jgi:hypothetical protein
MSSIVTARMPRSANSLRRGRDDLVLHIGLLAGLQLFAKIRRSCRNLLRKPKAASCRSIDLRHRPDLRHDFLRV